jgi:serine phosphatase RsbU (regulator of sigma subunit)
MYSLWDDAQCVLYIGNSGLPRPIQYRNGQMTIIEATGTPLGLLPGLNFDERRIESKPADVFLFPTDGILEACNDDGEEFGYAGIEKALSGCERLTADQIRDAIARALAAHCEEVETRDDQTLIVFKVHDAESRRRELLNINSARLKHRSGSFRLSDLRRL